MTKNSPEPDSGRLPENLDEDYNRADEFNGDVIERSVLDYIHTDLYVLFVYKIVFFFNFRDLTEVEDGEEHRVIGENGYELLPTSHCDEEEDDDGVEFGFSTFDGEEFHTRTSHSYHNLITTPLNVSTSGSSVESQSSIPLDVSQIETIKTIMSNVTLPSTVIPTWAHSVSDDQLKQVVHEKVGKGSNDNWAVFD